MKKSRLLGAMCVGIFTFASSLANAAILSSTAAFTLRSNTDESGPAVAMDSTWGNGGFDGFLTSASGQIDHSQVEFDMSAISGPVTSATLDWNLDEGFGTDTIYIDSYSGDGVAALTDWTLQAGSVGTATAAAGANSLDITSLINSSLGLGYLGISFSIDAHPAQAFFKGNPITINYEVAVVPVPAAVWLFGSGLLSLVGIARRKNA